MKYLLTFEFRYHTPDDDGGYDYHTKTVTLDVYDEFTDAAKVGNENLAILEKRYGLNPNYSVGHHASFNNFTEGECHIDDRRYLIGSNGYLENAPFTVYAKITTLHMVDTITATIDGIGEARA